MGDKILFVSKNEKYILSLSNFDDCILWDIDNENSCKIHIKEVSFFDELILCESIQNHFLLKIKSKNRIIDICIDCNDVSYTITKYQNNVNKKDKKFENRCNNIIEEKKHDNSCIFSNLMSSYQIQVFSNRNAIKVFKNGIYSCSIDKSRFGKPRAFTFSGKNVICTENSNIYIWDLKEMRCLKRLVGNPSRNYPCLPKKYFDTIVDDVERLVVEFYSDKRIRLLDYSTEKVLKIIKSERYIDLYISYKRNIIVFASESKVYFYDFNINKYLKKLQLPNFNSMDAIVNIVFFDDKQYMMVCSEKKFYLYVFCDSKYQIIKEYIFDLSLFNCVYGSGLILVKSNYENIYYIIDCKTGEMREIICPNDFEDKLSNSIINKIYYCEYNNSIFLYLYIPSTNDIMLYNIADEQINMCTSYHFDSSIIKIFCCEKHLFVIECIDCNSAKLSKINLESFNIFSYKEENDEFKRIADFEIITELICSQFSYVFNRYDEVYRSAQLCTVNYFEKSLFYDINKKILYFDKKSFDKQYWKFIFRGVLSIPNSVFRKFLPENLVNCRFSNSIYVGEKENEFYKVLYQNGGVVSHKYIPKPFILKGKETKDGKESE